MEKEITIHLLGLEDEAKKAELEKLKSGPLLLFTQRMALDQEFVEYCEKSRVSYCVMNFLSWLPSSEFGYPTVKALYQEIQRRAGIEPKELSGKLKK